MPRKRRPVTLEDALAYAIGRKRKLKGPRRDLYSFIIQQCLGNAPAAPEGMCDECEKTIFAPSARAKAFERQFNR